jgi:hypothetical protein
MMIEDELLKRWVHPEGGMIMPSRVLTNLIVVALCACSAPAEQPVQSFRGDILMMAVDEPNALSRPVPPPGRDAPEPWNPGEHLLTTWESISTVRTHRIYNPALQPPREPEGPGWLLSLAGQIDIVNADGLIGFSTTPEAILALDQNARLVFSELTDSQRDRRYQAPRYLMKPVRNDESSSEVERVAEIQPYLFSVNVPVDPGTTYPQLLGTLEWSMHALVADQFTTVDIPLQAGVTQVEPVSGLEIRVEQAIVENMRWEYSLWAEHGSSEVSQILTGMLDRPAGQTPPGVIVVNMEVLDAEGRPIRGVIGGTGVGAGGPDSRTTLFLYGMAYGPPCAAAATVRCTIAPNAYTRHIRFILENVPVPSVRD